MFGFQRILGRCHGPARVGVLCLASCAGLWGCGQKGPLFLPSQTTSAVPATAALPSSAPAQNVPAARLPDTPER
ncbi:lipoprotein [uncultured Hydrogenophaga sp.]|uniref:LPS translocon maturation chaperone LptM n=1 Tax=uncultured Hydrogenophaga sp. TaxID=199683 RepID=UPI00374A4681